MGTVSVGLVNMVSHHRQKHELKCFGCSVLQFPTTEIKHFASNSLDKHALLAALGPGCLGCILPGLIASDNVWSIP